MEAHIDTQGESGVEFRVLGPVEVELDGVMLDLGAPKQRSLLAFLLTSPNRVVATDRILDALWGEEAEGKENALWVYISRLRTILEPGDEADQTVLVTRISSPKAPKRETACYGPIRARHSRNSKVRSICGEGGRTRISNTKISSRSRRLS